MHFDPIVNYETNFYYWVQALCGWNVYGAELKQYQYYRERAGKLTRVQEHTLDEISEILQKADHPRSILAELYTTRLSSGEARRIKELSIVLKELFDQVWKQESEHLTSWRTTLKNLDTSQLEKPLEDIARFLKSDFDTRIITTVYLIINPPFGGSIGHVVRGHNFILLHPAGMEFENRQNITLSTLLHEYLHLLDFHSSTTEKLFKKSYDTYIQPLDINPPVGYTWKGIYSEIVAHCFANNITGGYFRPETFHRPRPTLSEMQDGFWKVIRTNRYTPNHLIAWIALNLLPDIEEYLASNKPIDTQLAIRMSKLILEIIIDSKFFNRRTHEGC